MALYKFRIIIIIIIIIIGYGLKMDLFHPWIVSGRMTVTPSPPLCVILSWLRYWLNVRYV